MAISLSADDHLDDLPRTLRSKTSRASAGPAADDGDGVVVRSLKVPFWRLAFFLVKCVLAGLPALVLLVAILWGAGELLEIYYPDLIKAKVVIQLAPNG